MLESGASVADILAVLNTDENSTSGKFSAWSHLPEISSLVLLTREGFDNLGSEMFCRLFRGSLVSDGAPVLIPLECFLYDMDIRSGNHPLGSEHECTVRNYLRHSFQSIHWIATIHSMVEYQTRRFDGSPASRLTVVDITARLHSERAWQRPSSSLPSRRYPPILENISDENTTDLNKDG